jgi:hypothetical protein
MSNPPGNPMTIGIVTALRGAVVCVCLTGDVCLPGEAELDRAAGHLAATGCRSVYVDRKLGHDRHLSQPAQRRSGNRVNTRPGPVCQEGIPMVTTTDYDAPRVTAAAEESLEVLQTRRSAPNPTSMKMGWPQPSNCPTPTYSTKSSQQPSYRCGPTSSGAPDAPRGLSPTNYVPNDSVTR